MEFFLRAKGSPSRLAVFPGSFNPVTVAHAGLARAALATVDEVVYVLPRVFPHKPYAGASFSQRLQLLCTAAVENEHCSVAAADGGLFVEIAAECREAYPPKTALTFLCGRDAAERIVNWDYGEPGAAAAMLRQFNLLVAARFGEYAPPDRFRNAIQTLNLAANFDHVSATEVREKIARGEPWEHLVPASALALAKQIYGAGPSLGFATDSGATDSG